MPGFGSLRSFRSFRADKHGAEEYRHRDKAGGHPGHRITSLDGPYWAFMPLPADTAELACRMTAVCLLRERINFAIDDLTFVVMHFQTHPNRDSILKAGGGGSTGVARRHIAGPKVPGSF
jgi:hypothetical protein